MKKNMNGQFLLKIEIVQDFTMDFVNCFSADTFI